MINITAIRTGSVRIRPSQTRRKTGGLLRVLVDSTWTEWLPIYVWLVEHPDGLFVVDTGETSRTNEPGYFPSWHPYYRRGVEMDVRPEQEVGPQLRARGVDVKDIAAVVLTHFHTDHVGGLHSFPDCRILAAMPAYRAARGLGGRVQGFLPHRWPAWLSPHPITFRGPGLGPFETSAPLTADGAVLVVPTPGHTPHHVSVIVRVEGVSYFLAGDTSYTEELLKAGVSDGVAPRPAVARATNQQIVEYARLEPTVYLPSHDPHAEARLRDSVTVSTA